MPAETGQDAARKQSFKQSAYTYRLIVKYRDPALGRARTLSSEKVRRLSASAGVALTHARAMSGNGHVLRLPRGMTLAEAEAVTAKLSADPGIEYAEPDRRLFPLQVPNDPSFVHQWHYQSPGAPGNEPGGANLPGAWDLTTGSAGVVAAVIDTGIINHAEFPPSRTAPGFNFISDPVAAGNGVGRSDDPSDLGDFVLASESSNAASPLHGCRVEDSSWHGSHVAGTIGGSANNNLGIAGINWTSKLLPVRVLGKCGGLTSDIIDGMRWAAGLSVPGAPANANPAKVINMSLGGPGACSTAMQSAITEVLNAGATIVVAAGNDSEDAANMHPANCSGVISVAAVNRAGGLASYSNYGTGITIAAPGGGMSFASDPNGVLSTLNTGTTTPVEGPAGDTYGYNQGTSMAAPHVAGVISLMLSIKPALTPAQVLQVLQFTARPFPTGTGSDCTTSLCGAGIIDAAHAVQVSGSDALFIGALPASLSFSASPGGPNPANRTLSISNIGGSPLFWSASANASWLSLSPTSGTDDGQATASVDITGLAAGTYTAAVSIAGAGAANSPVSVPVRLELTAPSNLLLNPGFESGPVSWTEHSNGGNELINQHGVAYAHSGGWDAYLAGYDNAVESLSQDVAIPSAAIRPYVSFWYAIETAETTTATAYDKMSLEIRNPGDNSHLGTLATLSNLDATEGSWVQSPRYDLSAYAGQTVRLRFKATTDTGYLTSFRIDDTEFFASGGAAITSTIHPTITGMLASGGTGSVGVTAESGCEWTATSNDAWITVTSGSSGSGSGTVYYSVNLNGGSTRTGTISIAGRSFTVTQAGSGPSNLLLNPGFERGPVDWTEHSSEGNEIIYQDGAGYAHGGIWDAYLGDYNNASESLYQDVAIPPDVGQAYVSFWYDIQTSETSTITASDTMSVEIRNPSDDSLLETLATLSNLDARPGSWARSAQYDLTAYAGRAIRLKFNATTNGINETAFFVDDAELTVTAWGVSPTWQSIGEGGGTGSVSVTAGSVYRWAAVSNDDWITVTGGASGMGSGTVTYSVAANTGIERTGTITISGQTFTVSQSRGCMYAIDPASAGMASSGGAGSVTVSAGSGCDWTATSNDAWITVTGDADGTGNHAVDYSVATNTGSERSGTITIAGRTFTVVQSSGCTYAIDPASAGVASGSGTGSVNVTAGSGCAWTATSNDAWITVTGGTNGMGSGTVNYSAAANTGIERTGTIAIAGQTFTVGQAMQAAVPDGDLDGGGVSVTDALRALRVAAGIISPTANDFAHGDVAPLVNGRPQPDGAISIGDAVVILQKAVGLKSW